MIRKGLFILFLATLTAGCRGALKSGWNNFEAYYNTYYNAKEYFKDGERAVLNQPRTLNPEFPVRVHPPPAPAGKESFEQAIGKSSQILRQHAESDWVDDALLLMGKSYYYLQDFATAIKWFEQLEELTPAPSMKQQAIIWKGRAMLDLATYQQGIAYLEEILQNYPPEWSAGKKGELQILAGEHHAMLKQWEQASDLLSAALSNISDQKLQGPVHFLYGQTLEWQDRLGEASYAYTQVPSYFPGFEYTYWSRVKQADIARKRGDRESALQIYRQLQQNDKYVDQYQKLAFEIARTLEMQGRAEEAELHYKALLYGEESGESRSLQADIHYRLGEIESEEYQDYTAAAAYFDTSASLRSQPESPSDDEAAALAEAFGQYTELQRSIHRVDSLLWLSSLSPERLDSVIDRARSERRQQLLEQQDDESEDQLLNQPELSAEPDTVTRSTIYGFLNHRSQNLVDQSKAEFRFIWNDRPLADNWRRREAIRELTNQREGDLPGTLPEEEMDEEATAATLNPEAIPQTEAQKARLKADRTRFRYQLGNVLFLNLDRPDSARVYYHKVVNSEDNPSLRPRAMYALYETFRSTEQTDSLRYWRDRIIADFPDSEYARLVTPGNGPIVETKADSTQKLLDQYRAIEALPDSLKAAQLRSLALANRTSELAPHIHYRAVEKYIRQARTNQQIADMLLANILTSRADSVDIAPKTDLFPMYSGAHWDSVRSILREHNTTFEGSPYRSRVEQLQEEIKAPDVASPRLPTCKEYGIRLTIEPDMQTFLQSVEWPESVNNDTLSGTVVYAFIVNESGEILSYQLESPSTSLGIEEALEAAFDEHLTFAPPDVDKSISKLQCRFSFPVKQ